MLVYLHVSTGWGCQSYSCSWSAEKGKWTFPCPRSRPRIWSRETGSAVLSRVSLLIFILKAESGAYLRDSSRFPRRRPLIYLNRHTPSVPRLSGAMMKNRRTTGTSVKNEKLPGLHKLYRYFCYINTRGEHNVLMKRAIPDEQRANDRRRLASLEEAMGKQSIIHR